MGGWKSLCTIDVELLLLKIHYFLMLGGAGGVMPYISLFGKSIGINGASIGLCVTVSTFLTIVTRPFLGSLVDYFRNVRYFLISLLIIFGASTFSFMFIPPIPEKLHNSVNSTELLLNSNRDFPEDYYIECSRGSQTSVNRNCVSVMESTNVSLLNVTDGTKFTKPLIAEASETTSHSPTFDVDELNASVSMIAGVTLETNRDAEYVKTSTDYYPNTTIYNPLNVTESSTLIYESYQVWIFAILLISSGLGSSNSMCLSDVACYSTLGERRELYGRQRLWGTIGWAVICALSGYLNDLSTGNNEREDYSSGFYIMVAFLPFDFLILSKIRMGKVERSKTMCSDVKQIFRSLEITVFAVGVSIIGFLTSITDYFEFWYLQELGAHQTLLGAVVFVQCSVEVIFFVITGWIVKKLGCFNCLICVFAAFAIRFGLLASITNPWWALAINTTHGVTFAVFHAALTNFASTHAPKGIEGTMLGIFGGLAVGLGAGTGSLTNGVMFDAYGGRFTITIASALSLVCVVLFACLNAAIYRCTNRKRKEIIDNTPSLLLKTIN